ncbi:hypothetical protein TNIN_447891 [Trichonephila inaurata madagascariensis]|uniref:Uncharacterized protein n=1 Tax=Trichonephila inaurata madagascariensis TaxID=2747483 RepID=A0A8X6YI20_9ARAC|nr:hypothetical protein TNIN_447891 [Trichonephila inaurata madagascariensis]
MAMSRRFPSGRNYINILVSGAPGCGATSLIESFISICDDVLIHREFRFDTMACQFRFFMDNHFYILRACDSSKNTITPPENLPVPRLHYYMDFVIYLYSIDDPDSLFYLMDLLEVKDDVGDLPSVLVGNKVDLRKRGKLLIVLMREETSSCLSWKQQYSQKNTISVGLLSVRQRQVNPFRMYLQLL